MRLALLLFLIVGSAYGARLKDIATLVGDRDNQLIGYGLVIGLAGTGDKSFDLSNQSLTQVLRTIGVNPKSPNFESKNIAAVICTATLPPFSRQGTRLNVVASSIGSAQSLEGGTLVMTALRGPDGVVYAMAQGKVVTIRRNEKGGDQTLVTAEIREGAILEKELNVDLISRRELRYRLHSADFTTAARAAKRINEELAGKYATAVDAGTIDVIVPYDHDSGPVELLAQIENVDIESDARAKVVVNARTGTVVFGGNVALLPVALAHDNLKIEIKSKKKDEASKAKKVALIEKRATLSDIVSSLNELGATADDLVSVLHALKASGALVAELEML